MTQGYKDKKTHLAREIPYIVHHALVQHGTPFTTNGFFAGPLPASLLPNASLRSMAWVKNTLRSPASFCQYPLRNSATWNMSTFCKHPDRQHFVSMSSTSFEVSVLAAAREEFFFLFETEDKKYQWLEYILASWRQYKGQFAMILETLTFLRSYRLACIFLRTHHI